MNIRSGALISVSGSVPLVRYNVQIYYRVSASKCSHRLGAGFNALDSWRRPPVISLGDFYEEWLEVQVLLGLVLAMVQKENSALGT